MEAFLKNLDLVPLDVLMIGVGAMLFVVFWKAMDKKFFGPFLQLLEARESLTTGAASNSRELREKAKELTRQYEEKLLAARVVAMEKKFGLIETAKNNSNALIEKATNEAKELLTKEKAAISASRERVRGEALGDAQSLVDDLVRKLKEPRLVTH